jgi:PHD/YefM family antitoxin component YafN of YafNO toxin-antitoxin module
MNFYSARDLRTIPKSIWNSLNADGEVVITNNGKPTALMLNISEDSFEELIRAVRQARAAIAFNSMRGRAESLGFMSDEDIEAEIKAARQEKKGR